MKFIKKFYICCILLFISFCASPQTKEVTEKSPEKGCVSGNCIDGVGKYIYDSGDIYEGSFKNGLRDGKGKMLYVNGDIYEGDYKNDLRDGFGVYTFKNGDVYEGNFKNGVREGDGTYKFNDGMIFKGTFIQDGAKGNGNLKVQDFEPLDCELKERKILCFKKWNLKYSFPFFFY